MVDLMHPDEIRDTFVKAFLEALPESCAKDEFSTNRMIAVAIGTGLAAVLIKERDRK